MVAWTINLTKKSQWSSPLKYSYWQTHYPHSYKTKVWCLNHMKTVFWKYTDYPSIPVGQVQVLQSSIRYEMLAFRKYQHWQSVTHNCSLQAQCFHFRFIMVTRLDQEAITWSKHPSVFSLYTTIMVTNFFMPTTIHWAELLHNSVHMGGGDTPLFFIKEMHYKSIHIFTQRADEQYAGMSEKSPIEVSFYT